MMQPPRNPYAPPRAAPLPPPAVADGPPLPWTTGRAIELAWEGCKANVGVVVGAALVYVVAIVLVESLPALTESLGLVHRGTPVGRAFPFAMLFVAIAVVSYVQTGMVRVGIAVARQQNPTFSMMFSGYDVLLKAFVFHVVNVIAIYAGILLLVVPGIVLAIAWSQATYYIADAKLGPFEAMAASWRVTRGHRQALFGMTVLSLLIVLAGVLACGVGVFFAVPVVVTAFAHVFNRLSGRVPSVRA